MPFPTTRIQASSLLCLVLLMMILSIHLDGCNWWVISTSDLSLHMHGHMYTLIPICQYPNSWGGHRSSCWLPQHKSNQDTIMAVTDAQVFHNSHTHTHTHTHTNTLMAITDVQVFYVYMHTQLWVLQTLRCMDHHGLMHVCMCIGV